MAGMNTQANLKFSASFGETRSFAGVAYSGGVVPGYGWLGDVAIDLTNAKIPARTFALLDHDHKQRAGVASFTIENNALRTSGRLLDTAFGEQIATLAAQGAPWRLSVGVIAEIVKTGRKPQMVNGQELVVDHIFRNPIIREVSFVTAGADPNTEVQVFAAQNPTITPDTKSLELSAALAQVNAELAELRASQLRAALPKLPDATLATLGTASKAVFAAILEAVASVRAEQPQGANLSAVQTPAGTKQRKAGDEGRHELALEYAQAHKVPYVDALIATYEAE